MIYPGDFFISKGSNGLSHDYYCICQLNYLGGVKTVSFPLRFKEYTVNVNNNLTLNDYHGLSKYFKEINLTDLNFIEALSSHIIREDSKEELKLFLTNLVQQMFKEDK